MDEVEEKRINPIVKALDFIDAQISRLEGFMLAVGVIAMTISIYIGIVQIRSNWIT